MQTENKQTNKKSAYRLLVSIFSKEGGYVFQASSVREEIDHLCIEVLKPLKHSFVKISTQIFFIFIFYFLLS